MQNSNRRALLLYITKRGETDFLRTPLHNIIAADSEWDNGI